MSSVVDRVVFVINVCHSIAGTSLPGLPSRGHVRVLDRSRRRCRRRPHLSFYLRRLRLGWHAVLCAAVCRRRTGCRSPCDGQGYRQGDHRRDRHGAVGELLGGQGRRSVLEFEPDVLHAVGHAFQDGTVIDLSRTGSRLKRKTCSPATRAVFDRAGSTRQQNLLGTARGNRRIGVWAVSILATAPAMLLVFVSSKDVILRQLPLTHVAPALRPANTRLMPGATPRAPPAGCGSILP